MAGPWSRPTATPSAKKVNRTMSRHLVRSVPFVVASVVGALVLAPAVASANVAVTQVSTDPFTDAQAQHRTEVEPDTFAFGNTIVSAFQVGRVSGGGASNIGFATSTNGGATWTQGFLPGITGNAGGPCGDRKSTRLNSSHVRISYAVFCLKKKKKN